jgi:glycerol-3-phosphate dehydrogenase
VGDLLVTSFSEKSRNRMLGELPGSIRSFSSAVELLHCRVAEGVPASWVCQQLGSKPGLKLPVMHTVYRILTEQARAEVRLLALLKNS